MRTLLIVSCAFLACGPRATPPSTQAPPAPPTASTPAPTAPPPSAAERNLFIDSVDAANPVVVTGRARTFENNVALRLRDAQGALVSETFTTAAGEMGNHNPFRGTLWVTRDPGSRITVEALEYSAKDGSGQSLVAAVRPFAVERIGVRLFFPDADCTGVRGFTRTIPKSVSHARLLVEALVAGPLPSETGATQPFPSGSRVESVNLRDGVLTVDFNERLQNVGGACRAQMIRQAVTRTLGSLPSVKRVVITAGGSESLALQP